MRPAGIGHALMHGLHGSCECADTDLANCFFIISADQQILSVLAERNLVVVYESGVRCRAINGTSVVSSS